MSTSGTTPQHYDPIARLLHWGMAILFFAQFLTAAAHWAFDRENEIRKFLWAYHTDIGLTLFALVFLRGLWGLATIRKRPNLHPGLMGKAALLGHLVLYSLMITVPSLRVLAAAGGKRGLDYFGIVVLPAKDTENAFLKGLSEWHGELGWVLAAVILGHILMALVWHGQVRKDGALRRMTG